VKTFQQLLLVLLFLSLTRIAAAKVTSLSQGAYVWQRNWNGAVRDAISEHGSNFETLVALKAEVSWRAKRPELVEVPLDYGLLKKSDARIGLALRVGPYPGRFVTNDRATTFLAGEANTLIREAQARMHARRITS
jgi:hypothetical protein